MIRENSAAPPGNVAGFTIGACAAASLIAILHHPTIRATSPAEVLAKIAPLAGIDRSIHGALILMALLLAWALGIFALRLGLTSQAVVAGLVADLVGTIAIVGAGLIDGFVVPQIAEAYVSPSHPELASAYGTLVLCSIAVSIATRFGFAAIAAASFVWSLQLLRSSAFVRFAGVVGCAIALTTFAAALWSSKELSPATLLPIEAGQSLWYLTIAALLIGKRV